jgi:ParB family chromosome partitioning protein
MNAQMIPLSQLSLSPLNRRRTGGKNVSDLVASIPAHGLLQNLIVMPAGEGFEVIAGGRRLRALQQLEAEGRLPADPTSVPCKVLTNGESTEASTAENAIRKDMHPADQFEAFRDMIDGGADLTEVAAHFGVAELVVRQRLKLGRVSPKILQAYRDEILTLKAVEAYALSDDHTEQEAVFTGNGGRLEYTIRQALMRKAVHATDKRLQVIGGLEAYEQAGGVVVRDLFDEEGTSAFATDAKLVNKLANQALEARAQPLRDAGWSFVDVGLSLSPYEYGGRSGAAEKADKTKTGAIVYADHSGKICIEIGLKRPTKKPEVKKAAATKEAKKKRDPSELDDRAVERLRTVRDLATAHFVATHPHVALAALAASAIAQLRRQASQGIARIHGIDEVVLLELNVGPTYLARDLKDANDDALQALEAKYRDLPPKGDAPVLAWALAQKDEVLLAITAVAVARNFDLGNSYQGRPEGTDHSAAFAELVKSDTPFAWKVTAEWISEQTREYVLAAVTEARGAGVAADLSQMKDKPFDGRAAALLEDAGWLPAPLRGPGYAAKAATGARPKEATPRKAPPAPKKAATKNPAKKSPAKAATKKASKKAKGGRK